MTVDMSRLGIEQRMGKLPVAVDKSVAWCSGYLAVVGAGDAVAAGAADGA